MVYELSTAIYAFMENVFAEADFPGLFTTATNVDHMLAEIVGSSFTARGRSE